MFHMFLLSLDITRPVSPKGKHKWRTFALLRRSLIATWFMREPFKIPAMQIHWQISILRSNITRLRGQQGKLTEVHQDSSIYKLEKGEVCYPWKGEGGFEGEKCALGHLHQQQGGIFLTGARGGSNEQLLPRVVEAPPGVDLNSLEGPHILAETPLLVA